MLVQQTIKSVINAVGVGLHSGQRVEVTLRPAKPDTGIIFRRIDLLEPISILTSALAVTDTRLASTISSGDVKVQTVEHLMSACAGMGIDNLLIDVNGEEVPILDGSASSFVFLIQSAGIEKQKVLKKFIRVLKPVVISEGEGASLKWAKFAPYDGYKLNFQIDFAHVAVNATGQEYEFNVSQNSYARDIARARTFCFTKDVELMRANGLALGGGLDNAIVIDDYKVINADGLRYGDEFVKHKILDAMGDLHLIGHPLLAEYNAFRSGHALNNKLIRKLMSQDDAYEIVTFPDATNAPHGYAILETAW
jgi:UDP-3-O-[3-hydroxymyristoyl] N-acetylglucosamine deacetylase